MDLERQLIALMRKCASEILFSGKAWKVPGSQSWTYGLEATIRFPSEKSFYEGLDLVKGNGYTILAMAVGNGIDPFIKIAVVDRDMIYYEE